MPKKASSVYTKSQVYDLLKRISQGEVRVDQELLDKHRPQPKGPRTQALNLELLQTLVDQALANKKNPITNAQQLALRVSSIWNGKNPSQLLHPQRLLTLADNGKLSGFPPRTKRPRRSSEGGATGEAASSKTDLGIASFDTVTCR